jgi:hypothetical protein
MMNIKIPEFHRVGLYDSALNTDIVIDFPKEQQWKMKVEHLRFTMPENSAWTDPIGFLKIQSESSQFIGTVITNGPTKMRDSALPILYPDQVLKQSVVGLFRGISNTGSVSFNFSMLGSDKKTVAVERMILVFCIMAEDGK